MIDSGKYNLTVSTLILYRAQKGIPNQDIPIWKTANDLVEIKVGFIYGLKIVLPNGRRIRTTNKQKEPEKGREILFLQLEVLNSK